MKKQKSRLKNEYFGAQIMSTNEWKKSLSNNKSPNKLMMFQSYLEQNGRERLRLNKQNRR